MKYFTLCLWLSFSTFGFSQNNDKISTIDFVQIIDNNKDEAIYYYRNNWEVLRKMAIEKDYIHDYQLLQIPRGEAPAFDIMLCTTYENKAHYDKSESNFGALIEARGPLNLLNEKKPGEFRKLLFSKENVRHLN